MDGQVHVLFSSGDGRKGRRAMAAGLREAPASTGNDLLRELRDTHRDLGPLIDELEKPAEG